MKKQIVFKPGQIFWIMCIAALSLLGACQKEKEMDGEGMIALSEIPDNPEYLNLPLIGTPWKLVGFADEKTGKIRLPESLSEDSYKVQFKEDGVLDGSTSTGEAYGRYSMATDKVLTIQFGKPTDQGELDDGYAYIEAMNKVILFQTTSRFDVEVR